MTIERRDQTSADRTAPPRVRQRARSNAEGARRRRRIAGAIGLTIAAVFMVNALVGDKGFLGGLKTRRQFDNLNKEIADLLRENALLLEETRRLQSDPSAIEETARRQLGLIHPGETLVIIKDAPSTKDLK